MKKDVRECLELAKLRMSTECNFDNSLEIMLAYFNETFSYCLNQQEFLDYLKISNDQILGYNIRDYIINDSQGTIIIDRDRYSVNPVLFEVMTRISNMMIDEQIKGDCRKDIEEIRIISSGREFRNAYTILKSAYCKNLNKAIYNKIDRLSLKVDLNKPYNYEEYKSISNFSESLTYRYILKSSTEISDIYNSDFKSELDKVSDFMEV